MTPAGLQRSLPSSPTASRGGAAVLDRPRTGAARPPRQRASEPPRWIEGSGGGGDDWGGDERPEPDFGPRGPNPDAARFALWLALIGIATLFAVLLACWLLVRRPPDPAAASPLVPPLALWSSTAFLAASSWSLARAERVAPAGRGRHLGAALALGSAFLASQALLWNNLIEARLVPSAGPYAAFLFALTGLHALHVLCGLAFVLRCWLHHRRAKLTGLPLRMAAVYWHFMGALWLVLFLTLVLVG